MCVFSVNTFKHNMCDAVSLCVSQMGVSKATFIVVLILSSHERLGKSDIREYTFRS